MGKTRLFILSNITDFFYIVKGHHQFLAACNLGAKKVRTYLVDYHSLSFLSNPRNIESTLSCVGKTAIYDFEGIGNFKYNDYPEYYK